MNVKPLTDDPEWQKMLSGDWYLTNTKVLSLFRRETKQVCQLLDSLDEVEKATAINQLLPQVRSMDPGHHFNCDYGVNIKCDGHFTVGAYLTLLDGPKIDIGNEVVFGSGVVIATVTHHENPEKRLSGWQRAREIKIGNRVCVGDSVSILAGAVIPDNTKIASGTVVTAASFRSHKA